MATSKPVSELTNKAVPGLTDRIYISTADAVPLDRYSTVQQVLQTTSLYKKYIALLTQTGVAAPVATVLENTLGAIVWGYTAPGNYTATLAGAFTANKTFVFIKNSTLSILYPLLIEITDINTITINSYNNSTALADNIITNASIEIRVYS